MKVLIVEDDFLTRRLLQSYLSPYGICDITVNGLEAVKAFGMAWEENSPYDLMCLDILMPEMDGKELLQVIRNMEEGLNLPDEQKIKIIVVSILSDIDDIQDLKDQCGALISKPIEKKKLIAALQKMNLIQIE